MYKNIKLPAPQLSELKEVNIDLDMTGRHYALIATSGDIPEDTALSVLHDLVDEDANKLTMSELYYLFTLVKIHSLEDDYTATVECPYCKHTETYDLHLSDSDLHRTPDDYKAPEIEFCVDKEKGIEKFTLKPPTMDMESALYNWYLTDKDITYEDLQKDLSTAMDYSFIRACMCLVRPDGSRPVYEPNQFETVLSWMDINKFNKMNELYLKIDEINSFGVHIGERIEKCKECGEDVVFHLPLFFGLLD